MYVWMLFYFASDLAILGALYDYIFVAVAMGHPYIERRAEVIELIEEHCTAPVPEQSNCHPYWFRIFYLCKEASRARYS